jgi:hypothetical protein
MMLIISAAPQISRCPANDVICAASPPHWTQGKVKQSAGLTRFVAVGFQPERSYRAPMTTRATINGIKTCDTMK